MTPNMTLSLQYVTRLISGLDDEQIIGNILVCTMPASDKKSLVLTKSKYPFRNAPINEFDGFFIKFHLWQAMALSVLWNLFSM